MFCRLNHIDFWHFIVWYTIQQKAMCNPHTFEPSYRQTPEQQKETLRFYREKADKKREEAQRKKEEKLQAKQAQS